MICVAMTPAYILPYDSLLVAQLKALARQTYQDFEVLLVDPHYQKRKSFIPQVAQNLKLNLIHFPYIPATHVAKNFDCAIFNTPFVLTTRPKVARLSDYRYVRPTWIETMMQYPVAQPLDFYYNNLNIDSYLDYDLRDFVNLHQIPPTDDNLYQTTDPLDCKGNICYPVDKWLELNGADETISNVYHWEDYEFNLRANNAGYQVARIPNQLFRFHHLYGGEVGYANAAPDVPQTRRCPVCDIATHTYNVTENMRVANITGMYEIYTEEGHRFFRCPRCLLCSILNSEEYVNEVRASRRIRSGIGWNRGLTGRNLRILREDIQKAKSLGEKAAIFANSWTNARYLTP